MLVCWLFFNRPSSNTVIFHHKQHFVVTQHRNTNTNATTTMSINNTTNNIDEMNIIKMKCSKDYDIVGTLQGYYTLVSPEHQLGVHKRRWDLDGGTITKTGNDILNLAERVQLMLDYYKLLQYLEGGYGTGCTSLDFFSKCWGFTSRISTKSLEQQLDRAAVRVNSLTNKYEMEVLSLYLQYKPSTVLVAEELPDTDSRIMLPDIRRPHVSDEQYRATLVRIAGENRPRKVDVPGCKYSSDFKRGKIYVHDIGNLKVKVNCPTQPNVQADITVDYVDSDTSSIVLDASKALVKHGSPVRTGSGMKGAGVRAVFEHKPLFYTRFKNVLERVVSEADGKTVTLNSVLEDAQKQVSIHVAHNHYEAASSIKHAVVKHGREKDVIGGSGGLSAYNIATRNLHNASHYDCYDDSMSISVYTVESGESEQYMLFPNLSITVGAQNYVGLAIKLQHGLCISWNGLKCRHCTTEATSGITSTLALFSGVPNYATKHSYESNTHGTNDVTVDDAD